MSDVTRDVSSSKPEFVSIAGESFREYDFGHGKKVFIHKPLSLNVKRKPEGDSHRILDSEGKAHYIPAGWIHLSWGVIEGDPFQF